MNLRGLQIFRDIVLTGTLADAAERSNLSTSAASRLVGQLETQLGLTLFSRARRTLALTEEGTLFYRQISSTLDALKEIPQIAREVATRGSRTLSIVAATPIANQLVVPTLAKLKATTPECDFSVGVESRFAIESKVAAGGYDLGLISLPVENVIVPLDIVPLIRARLCVFMPADHPLARQASVTLEQLASEVFVTLAAGQRWRDRLDALLGAVGYRPIISHQTGSTVVTLEMARHGIGITISDAVFSPPQQSSAMALLPIEGDHWITYAAIHARGQRPPHAEPFLDALSEHIERQCAANPTTAELMHLI
ncbi:LysR family transcriptional regulator [Roseibium sp. CAU 1637]|uniref:LysR family transcriptional regulator n=1 Tax=Roseibium limicola TaxID=2816037 RepID=A0A939EM71_9HYPH|nr:LysR family transcriptional regulator [Roseibium limicola]MBO0344387.1 LysR family transcriptional regulator [Roseibium limicola]